MIKIQPNGAFTGAKSIAGVLRGIAQQYAASVMQAASVDDLTDNSGGTAGDTIALPGTLTATDADGSNLASKTTTQNAIDTVVDGLVELVAKANTIATAVGLDTVTDTSGGTAADGTIAAVTVATTGAATGAALAETEALRKQVNNYIATAVGMTNEICASVGVSKLQLSGLGDHQSTVAAISVDVGTAATPGVSKADMDALLAVWRNHVASIAAKLTEANAVTGSPKVLAG